MDFGEYSARLDAWAGEERALAEGAREKGDERARSIHLMKANMLSGMLISLGRVEMSGERVGVLAQVLASCEQNEAALRARGDFDGADRERVKAETIACARAWICGEAEA